MIKHCLVCEKEFRTYPSKIKIGRGKYCSKQCSLTETNKILEESVGRHLTSGEVVHHKNHDTQDNRIENLELMTAADHRREHLKDNVHKRWIK